MSAREASAILFYCRERFQQRRHLAKVLTRHSWEGNDGIAVSAPTRNNRSKELYNFGGMLQHSCSASAHILARKAPLCYIHTHSRAGFQLRCHFNGTNREVNFNAFQWNKSRGELSTMTASIRSCFSGSYLSKLQNNLVPGEELFNIIKSACCEPEGLGHHWLNNFCNDNRHLNQGGITLVLVNAYIQDDSLVDRHDRILIIEGVKLIRKRYPKLNVIGLQCVSSANSTEIHSEVLKTIMEEYISFPILLLDRNLIKVIDSAVYLFFEGAPSHAFCIKTDAELGSIKKAINELSLLLKENMPEKLNGDGNQDPAEEPCAASAFRNLLLYNADWLFPRTCGR